MAIDGNIDGAPAPGKPEKNVLPIIKNGEGIEFSVTKLEDLHNLPDRSIEVLYNNQNYVETIYLYVLFKLDMYLEKNSHPLETRIQYFNMFISILPKLIKNQEVILSGKRSSSDGCYEGIPSEILMAYKNCLESTCDFFSGILSTTPYLDSNSFQKEKTKTMKDKYAYTIQMLKLSLQASS